MGIPRLLIALFLLLVLAPHAPCQQYPFLLVPGSPKNVQGLFQDSLGRLWLTGTDLAYFDGVRFFFLRDYGYPGTVGNTVAEDAGGARPSRHNDLDIIPPSLIAAITRLSLLILRMLLSGC
jgi:hypothetical protein